MPTLSNGCNVLCTAQTCEGIGDIALVTYEY